MTNFKLVEITLLGKNFLQCASLIQQVELCGQYLKTILITEEWHRMQSKLI